MPRRADRRRLLRHGGQARAGRRPAAAAHAPGARVLPTTPRLVGLGRADPVWRKPPGEPIQLETTDFAAVVSFRMGWPHPWKLSNLCRRIATLDVNMTARRADGRDVAPKQLSGNGEVCRHQASLAGLLAGDATLLPKKTVGEVWRRTGGRWTASVPRSRYRRYCSCDAAPPRVVARSKLRIIRNERSPVAARRGSRPTYRCNFPAETAAKGKEGVKNRPWHHYHHL
jgi:hypothetical protein